MKLYIQDIFLDRSSDWVENTSEIVNSEASS
jgi:hypothetical protein